VSAAWIDSSAILGQARGIDRRRALATRPGLSFVETSGGQVRIRRGAPSGPRVLLAMDGPNVLEHTDALFAALDGRVELIAFEPNGTGASAPEHGFDFTLSAFLRTCGEVLTRFEARTLVFPCYLGFVGQALARALPDLVTHLVTPQTPSWDDMHRWAEGVDRRRLVRTPYFGQVLMRLRKRAVAAGWYRASTSERRFREPFIAAANEAFSFGGCFCLASLMQGLERSQPPSRAPLTIPVAIPWGGRDRTHLHSRPAEAFPRSTVVGIAQTSKTRDASDNGSWTGTVSNESPRRARSRRGAR
jgi:hypothetical protein